MTSDKFRNLPYLWLLILSSVHKVKGQCSGSSLSLTASPEPTKFTSPGYPIAYSNDLICQWLIDSGTAGQSVMIYSDHYDLDCPNNDFINIYDGSTTGGTLLASNLCGADLETDEYVSSGRYILVTFTTDSSLFGQGLQMTYLSAPDTSGTGCTAEYTLTATTTPQYLTSGGFPSEYSSNSACRWLITASGSMSIIELAVTFSDIEEGATCNYDKLTVYHGSDICEKQMMFTDCTARTSADATPIVYTSSTNSVLLLLTSDSSVNFRGFIVKYTAYIITTTTAATTTTPSVGSSLVGTSTTNTEKELSIPLMVASAVGGACFVLLIVAGVWMVRMLKSKKRHKKGAMMVQSIAPLPARSAQARLFAPRDTTLRNINGLSFV